MATEAADVTAVAKLKFEAEGTDQLKSLAASLEALGKIAASVGKQVQAVQAGGTGGGAGKPAPTPPVPTPKLPPGITKSIEQIFTAIGAAIRTGLKLPFDALKAAVTATGPVLSGLANMFGSFFTSLTRWVASVGPYALVVVPALAGIAYAFKSFLVAAGQVAIGFKLLSSSLDWAKDFAKEALKINQLTKQLSPVVFGAQF